MKKIFSILLCAIMLFSTFSFQIFSAAAEYDTAESLTKEWYGDINSVIIEDKVDETLISKDVKKLLEKYLAIRELSFNKPNAKADFSIFAEELSAAERFEKRNKDVDSHEIRINSEIVFAEVTLKIKEASVVGEKITLSVYEWTFYDYLDNAGDKSRTDVSGFGTTHEIVIDKVENDLVIVADNYEDSTLEFDAFVEENNAKSDNSQNAQAKSNGIVSEDLSVDKNGEFMMGYDIGAAVAYSDRYWSDYNPDWYNFASLGGDCANFVSQCLYAGGMPMHYGAAYAADCWFYTTSSDRSSSWTGAAQSYSYWSNYRGIGIVNPNNSQVWIGCPVYVDWYSDGLIDHAYFCVGRNSSGTAIINSHTGDKYHINWNYGYGSSTYYTVQVTAQEGVSTNYNKQLEGHDPVDLGPNFYAHIRQTATGLYVTDKDFNVCVDDAKFDSSQTWLFSRQSDGTYTIINESTGYCWDVDNNNYGDGNNIKMYSQTGGNAQKFFVYYINGNFYFKTLPEDKTIDIDANSRNIQLYGCSTGIGEAESNPVVFNARSFEILKINIDFGSWNMYMGSSFVCYIRNVDSGLLMTADGNNVIFADQEYTDNQKWIVTRNEYGGHEIKSVATGKVLDVEAARLDAGANVDLYDANNSKAQRFFFISADNSEVYIKPSYAANVLDMDAGSKELHIHPHSTSDLARKAQVFQLITEFHIDDQNVTRAPAYLGEKFTTNITLSSNGKVMAETNDGLTMSTANGDASQTWTLTYDKNWNAYEIVGASGKAIDVTGLGWWDGLLMGTYEANGSAAQRFRFYSCVGGYYISPVSTQKVIDIDTSTGTTVQLWGSSASENRIFALTALSYEGKAPANFGESFTTTIKNIASNLNLNEKGESLEFAQGEQEWTFVRQANGSYVIKSKLSGKVLDIDGAKADAGTKVQLWEENGSKAQSFFIYESNGGYVLMPSHCLYVVDMDSNAKTPAIYQLGTSEISVAAQTFALPGAKPEVTPPEGGDTPSEPVLDVLELIDNSSLIKSETYLKKVKSGMTASDVIKNFKNTDAVIYDANGNKMESASKVGTGCSVNLLKDGKVIDSLTIIITGDVDGNGVVNSTDYLRLKNAFINSYVIEGAAFVAGDVDANGTLNSTDYLRLKSAFLGNYDLNA